MRSTINAGTVNAHRYEHETIIIRISDAIRTVTALRVEIQGITKRRKINAAMGSRPTRNPRHATGIPMVPR